MTSNVVTPWSADRRIASLGVHPRITCRPSAAHGAAVADVDRHDDTVGAMCRDQAPGECRLLDGPGPDDGPGRAGRERLRDGFLIPQAAGDLHPDSIAHGPDDARR